ncbi:MAG: succinylglutamate desuccinylase/aspartoacylase family protein, partial [Flammeovirgaceae bacterium]|nr:succinylglutamate desuccinylase/aspartoacylase family protein [Flammeovirgaceae bacterium]
HGNETSGVIALERVFDFIEKEGITLKGRFVGIRGNIAALKSGRRYIDKDMNRVWDDETVKKVIKNTEQISEYSELKEIFEVFQKLQFNQYPDRIFLDLHTTSAENGIFIMVEELETTGYIVEKIHAPMVLGLHKGLLNTSIPYMHMHGFTSLAFEAGKIGSYQSVHNHEMVIWQVLCFAGFIDWEDVPVQIQNYNYLSEKTAHLPKKMILEYCHHIQPQDQFKMKPGFKNFDKVEKGEVVAWDKKGEILAPAEGFMLMPLYQPEGSDGFFIVKELEG